MLLTELRWSGPSQEALNAKACLFHDATPTRLLTGWQAVAFFLANIIPPGFSVFDSGHRIELSMRSLDGQVIVKVTGADTSSLPGSSCFDSLDETSAFFEGGSLGYSVTRKSNRLDGLRLRTLDWRVSALSVSLVESSFFSDRQQFPEGSVEFDHALVMRDLRHEWHKADDLYARPGD